MPFSVLIAFGYFWAQPQYLLLLPILLDCVANMHVYIIYIGDLLFVVRLFVLRSLFFSFCIFVF